MSRAVTRAVTLALVVVGALGWLWLGTVTAACASGMGQLAQAFSARDVATCQMYGALHAAAGWLAVLGAAGFVLTFLIGRRRT